MQIRKRDDIDPDKGIQKYGEVEFADSVNNKYPIDTPERVRSAWAHIHVAQNTMFYTPAELEIIKSKIVEAAKRFEIELAKELVERDARLFAAGDYPDRGIEITEDDLDRMVEGHKPVPIKIEHTDSPLDLGMVTKLWRAGKELFGRLVFTAPAWDLVQTCGAKKLSAAVKRDKSKLVEVSLVRNPRIADAAIFGGEGSWVMGHGLCNPDSVVGFSFEVEDGGENMSETKTVEFSKRIAELEGELKSREAESRIDLLKRAGKLTPASEPFALALLTVGDAQVVTFSDGTEKPVSETFLAFLESQPKVIEFSELAEGGKETVEVSDAERELCAKLGISPEAVAKQRRR